MTEMMPWVVHELEDLDDREFEAEWVPAVLDYAFYEGISLGELGKILGYVRDRCRKTKPGQRPRDLEDVVEFANEICEFRTDAEVEKQELYDRYRRWAKGREVKPQSYGEFGRRVRQLPVKTVRRKGQGDERCRMWLGMAVREVNDVT